MKIGREILHNLPILLNTQGHIRLVLNVTVNQFRFSPGAVHFQFQAKQFPSGFGRLRSKGTNPFSRAFQLSDPDRIMAISHDHFPPRQEAPID